MIVAAAAAGALHSPFLKKDGDIWAIGWVGSEALGDGFSVDLEKKSAHLYDQKKANPARPPQSESWKEEQPFLNEREGPFTVLMPTDEAFGRLEVEELVA